MSKGNTTENDVMLYMFHNTAPSWSANGNWYVGLHTGDPGEAGNQTTNECAYGGYARQAVARSSVGWTISGNTVQNAATISYPECTSGSESVTYVSLGTTLSGAGQILYSGALNAARSVSSGITLQFAAGALTITED